MTIKALIFAHLAASQDVLFLELYFQLNAVSSGPLRTSKGRLCWVDMSHRITESQNSRGWKGPVWVI